MQRRVEYRPKPSEPLPEGIRVAPPESNRLSAQDIKDDQRRQYSRRSQLATQRGVDPDKVEEARLMKWFRERNGRKA